MFVLTGFMDQEVELQEDILELTSKHCNSETEKSK